MTANKAKKRKKGCASCSRKELRAHLWEGLINDILGSIERLLASYPRSVTSIICSFNSCLKVTFLYFPVAIGNHLIMGRLSGDPMFTFVVYGLELLDSGWFVFIVLVLVLVSFFGCVSSKILTVPLFISFCVCSLRSLCHMMSVHV